MPPIMGIMLSRVSARMCGVSQWSNGYFELCNGKGQPEAIVIVHGF